MKKYITAAAFAATLGVTTSVAFAANPFEDVPADHWANDAIAQLAAKGVIEGYGDGTYRGEQQITRYEVAQIVARAMAKEGVSGADKATVDKLAAEFGEELSALGVRVAALEKKVDNVRWTGMLAYEYWNDQHKAKVNDAGYADGHLNRLQFRLEPRITINKNWSARARLKFLTNDADNNGSTSSAKTAANGTKVQTDRAWVTGRFGKTTINLGKFAYEPNLDHGLVFGNRIMGAQASFGNKLRVTVSAGRHNNDPDKNRGAVRDIQTIELDYKASKKLNIGAAFYHTKQDKGGAGLARFAATRDGSYTKAYNDDEQKIWEVGINYKLGKLWNVNAAYAQNEAGDWGSKYNKAYELDLAYNGGRYPAMKKGNFGGFVAYRYLGRGAVIAPTYDEVYYSWNGSEKGLNIGAAYAFDKNVLGTVLYVRGKDISATGDTRLSTLYSTIQFFF